MEPKVFWLGHASFRIESEGKTIYIDPWKLKDGPKADMILITHSHYDHLSEEDIAKVKKESTVVVGPKDVSEKMQGVSVIDPGQSLSLEGISIEGHAAYNPKKEFHPKENRWLGYVLDIDGYRLYHSGDTDITPEMKGLKDIDLALLPVGGTYTMSPEEAAEAVDIFKPKKAIPMHWGDIVGGKKDAEKFKELASCIVDILEPTE